MTTTTRDAASVAGCNPLTARRLGVAMKGRPVHEPLWSKADVRHLCAAVALATDSPQEFYTDDEVLRITRGARHPFVRYIIVRERMGVGVRDMDRVLDIIGDLSKCQRVARVMYLDSLLPLAVAS